MKPAMKQDVTFFLPVLDAAGNPVLDTKGRPLTEPLDVKGNVTRKTSLKRDSRGQEARVTLEIDVPPNIIVPDGTRLIASTKAGERVKAVAVTQEEAPALSMRRVHYRTVFADG